VSISPCGQHELRTAGLREVRRKVELGMGLYLTPYGRERFPSDRSRRVVELMILNAPHRSNLPATRSDKDFGGGQDIARMTTAFLDAEALS
jgi:hypothetical protein